MSETRVLAPVNFHGQELMVLGQENEPYVAMRPVVEGMGLAWKPQYLKLQEDAARWGVTIMVTVGSDGKDREMLCIPLRKLFGWLMSVHAGKVAPHLREKVILYQSECDEVLWRHWTNRGVPTLKTPAQLILESAHVLVDHENRLQFIEAAVKRIEETAADARTMFWTLPDPSVDLPELTRRMQIEQVINLYVQSVPDPADQRTRYRSCYRTLYNEYRLRYHFDIPRRFQGNLDRGMDMRDEHGKPIRSLIKFSEWLSGNGFPTIMDNLYALACSIFKERSLRLVPEDKLVRSEG